MQEINVLHGCLISTTIKENTNEDFNFFSEITAFAKLLHVEFISCVCGIQQFYAHTCTRCGPIFSFRSWFLLGGMNITRANPDK